jgi:hypothetical protein
VLGVVEPDADDLLRVGDRRQQADLVERDALAVRLGDFAGPAGGQQFAHAQPGVDDPVVPQYPGPRPIPAIEAHQSHGSAGYP